MAGGEKYSVMAGDYSRYFCIYRHRRRRRGRDFSYA